MPGSRPGLDFVAGEAPIAKHGLGVGAARARRRAHLGWRAAEARRGGRLQHAVALDEGAARRVVGVMFDLAEGQHRRNAGVAAREDSLPFVARARGMIAAAKRRRSSGQPLRSCCGAVRVGIRPSCSMNSA